MDWDRKVQKVSKFWYFLNSKTSILKFGPSNLDSTILMHTLTVWMCGICDCSKSKSDYFNSKHQHSKLKLYLIEENVKIYDYTIPIFFQLFPLYFFTAAIKSLSCKWENNKSEIRDTVYMMMLLARILFGWIVSW